MGFTAAQVDQVSTVSTFHLDAPRVPFARPHRPGRVHNRASRPGRRRFPRGRAPRRVRRHAVPPGSIEFVGSFVEFFGSFIQFFEFGGLPEPRGGNARQNPAAARRKSAGRKSAGKSAGEGADRAREIGPIAARGAGANAAAARSGEGKAGENCRGKRAATAAGAGEVELAGFWEVGFPRKKRRRSARSCWWRR